MKSLQHQSSRRPEGSVLLITLLVALGLGVVLASYLLMIRGQYVSVVRSQAWHSALTMAEAGVEEALAQLNSVPFTNTVPAGNGWGLADELYHMDAPRTMLGGQFGAAYTSNVPPTIYATGYATVPTISATIERVVEVKTTLAPLFSIGAAVRGSLKMNGKKLFTDSYDSSIWPRRYDPDWAPDQGDVAVAGGIADPGNVDIHGRLFLGATATSTNFDASGGILPDFNADFPEVLPPSFSGPVYTPEPGSNGTTAYAYYLGRYGSANYGTSNLNGSVFVADNAEAVLYVTGNANIPNLVIASNATLKLYVGGGNTTFGVVTNFGTPRSFQYYGLPGNTNVTMTGWPDCDRLMGVIYAPNARFQAGEKSTGNPYDDFDLYGAIVVNSMDVRSALKLHFDESLKNTSQNGVPLRGFVVDSWRELPPP